MDVIEHLGTEHKSQAHLTPSYNKGRINNV